MHSYRIIIPTYQAQPHLAALLPALASQGMPHDAVLVVDSSSRDTTVQSFRKFGAEVLIIPQSDFNHGGTRRAAANHCRQSSFLIFITQDAIPCAGAFDRLLQAFEDDSVGMAYGRQLPRQQAGAIERHARLVNYPAGPPHLRALSDKALYGVKTTFCSNSFAAYRSSALASVESFPEDAFFAEDQITAARMLMKEWKLAYVPEAQVIHSHGYSPLDEFRRYFDIGVFHARNRWILETFGMAEGEGLKFVRSELSYLIKQAPFSIPSAWLRTILKYAGYRLGQLESSMSPSVKARLSMAPHYWQSQGSK
jgi:rhamnosyltransferase